MRIFITGTDTNAGKTIVCSWLCLHLGYDYFKPIQTGISEGRDSSLVAEYSGAFIHPETYCFQAPLSPHLAASAEHETIDIQRIHLPPAKNLIIEGAGGVLVPINSNTMMIDLIKQFNVPVILVTPSRLGMINHTLLSLEALRSRNINTLGVIVSGELNEASCRSIEQYGKTKILAQLPHLSTVNRESLSRVPCELC